MQQSIHTNSTNLFFSLLLLLKLWIYVQNNLASLLKTAEELRIKGLAEVSWRDDEVDDGENNDSNNNVTETLNSSFMGNTPATTSSITGTNGKVPFLAPSPSPGDYSSVNRKKRGRPPLDDSPTANFSKG